MIDSVAALLDQAQKRHYQKWPILGMNVGTPEYGDQPDTYEGEVIKLKSWISRRLAWLDANMVGDATGIDDRNATVLRVFPNPASDYLRVESDAPVSTIGIFSITGSKITEYGGINENVRSINVSGLSRGIYILRIEFVSGKVLSRKFVKK
jgi:hypothetical protein